MADATPPPPLRQRWEHDVRGAIAGLHDARARASAQRRFDDMVTHLPSPGGAPDRRALRAALDHEYAIPGRLNLAPVAPARKSWLQRVWDWIVERIDDVLNPLVSRLHLGKKGSTGLGLALIVIVGLFLAFVLARLVRLVGFVRDDRRAYITPLEAQRNAHALMLESSALAAQGRYADAVRLLFRAAVALLDLRGAITDDAAATVNELFGELRERSSVAAPAFLDLATQFTFAAYARRPVSAAAYASARDAYERLRAVVTT